MTDTLWIRFADDSGFPEKLLTTDEAALQKIFDMSDKDSLWHQSLDAIGLHAKPTVMVRFVDGTAYINWTAMTGFMTGGMLQPIPNKDKSFQYKTITSPMAFFRFLRNQWKISVYLEKTLPAALPQAPQDQVRESLALGLALLSLTPRLPRHTPEQLGMWMSDIPHAPKHAQKTLQQIQKLQMRRTQLSSGWKHFITGDDAHRATDQPPALFWNEPSTIDTPASATISTMATSWKGIPVVSGNITAEAIVVTEKSPDEMQNASHLQGKILVFARARPETVLFFDYASAILYAEGGTLSHACTVAREQKIPCVTGLGKDFIPSLKTGDILKVDASTGTVTLNNR